TIDSSAADESSAAVTGEAGGTPSLIERVPVSRYEVCCFRPYHRTLRRQASWERRTRPLLPKQAIDDELQRLARFVFWNLVHGQSGHCRAFRYSRFLLSLHLSGS